jgi:hypothetical protein
MTVNRFLQNNHRGVGKGRGGGGNIAATATTTGLHALLQAEVKKQQILNQFKMRDDGIGNDVNYVNMGFHNRQHIPHPFRHNNNHNNNNGLATLASTSYHRKQIMLTKQQREEQRKIDKNNHILPANEIFKLQNQKAGNNAAAIEKIAKMINAKIQETAKTSTIIKHIEFTVPIKLDSVDTYDIDFVTYALKRNLRKSGYNVNQNFEGSSTIIVGWD